MSDIDLPLFQWKPPVKFIPFPLSKQVGKIRDVASKLSTKTTDRHATHYQNQVTDALTHRLRCLGFSADVVEAEIAQFWRQVQNEVIKLQLRGGDVA